MTTRAEILPHVKSWRHHGLSVGYASGAWDALHFGHLTFLEEAHARCDRLIVAVTADATVRAAKGAARPFHPAEHRLALVAALRPVAGAFVFSDYGDDANLDLLRPDVFFRGSDYARRPWHEQPTLARLGIRRVVLLTDASHIRTSALAGAR